MRADQGGESRLQAGGKGEAYYTVGRAAPDHLPDWRGMNRLPISFSEVDRVS